MRWRPCRALAVTAALALPSRILSSSRHTRVAAAVAAAEAATLPVARQRRQQVEQVAEVAGAEPGIVRRRKQLGQSRLQGKMTEAEAVVTVAALLRR